MSNGFTETQIVGILKEAETVTPIADLCCQYDVEKSTFYTRRSQHGGMNAADVKRLKALERESRRLKKMYTKLSLKRQMEEVIKK